MNDPIMEEEVSDAVRMLCGCWECEALTDRAQSYLDRCGQEDYEAIV